MFAATLAAFAPREGTLHASMRHGCSHEARWAEALWIMQVPTLCKYIQRGSCYLTRALHRDREVLAPSAEGRHI